MMEVRMKVTRFYATESGESRFEEIEVPMNPRDDGSNSFTSNLNPSPGFHFVELPAGRVSDWHHAPARQIVTVLSGVVEVTTSDNQKRQWRSGEQFFAEDLTGKGHLTAAIGGAARLWIVRVPEKFDAKKWAV
jgi:quercetin dioxygenase-like cupin family protein